MIDSEATLKAPLPEGAASVPAAPSSTLDLPKEEDVLQRMAGQLTFLYDNWPELQASVDAIRSQQTEHERRIMRLERVYGMGVMNTPLMITKFIIYALVVLAIVGLMALGKIDHAQMMQDITIVSSMLIFALGLQGGGDRIGQAIAKIFKPSAPPPPGAT